MGRDKGAPGINRLVDVADLPFAGVSNYRIATRHQEKLGGGGGRVDFSLLHHVPAKHGTPRRLDPSAYPVPAGGLVRPERGKLEVAEAATDPITHFRHLGLDVPQKYRVSKRSGYKHPAAGQTWTWAQDPKVVASTGLLPRPEVVYLKASVGADGVRRPFVWGGEDLLPGATRDFVKCDRPAEIEHIIFNDKELLPYCLREGPYTEKRPVHEHWRSDRMWDVMYDDSYIDLVRREDEQAGPGGQPKSSANDPPQHPAGVSTDWKLALPSRDGKQRRRSYSEDCPRHAATDGRRAEECSSTRGSTLSMSSPSVNRCDARGGGATARRPASGARAPRSTTPRRPSARDSGAGAAPPEALARRGAASELRAQAEGPRIERRRSADASSRSAASQSTTSRSAAGLSMTPTVVSRRDPTAGRAAPRRSTPRASAPQMRKSTSEVINR